MFDTQDTRAFLLLSISTFLLTIISINGQPSYNHCDCSGPDNDSDSANYIDNLTSLLGSLSSKASTNSFYNDTFNQIYSLYLCRGDVDATTCQNCVKTASQEIQKRCQSNKTAIIWYDECIIRYSNLNFFGIGQTTPMVLMWNAQNTSSREEPPWEAVGMISELLANAPYAENMFNTSEKKLDSGYRYGLVQCSRDMGRDECRNCLTQLRENISQCCNGRRGWQIMCPSCYLRYEDHQFYNHKTLAPSPPPPPSLLPSLVVSTLQGPPEDDQGKGGENITKTVIITVSTCTAVVVLFGFYIYCSVIRRKHIPEEGTGVEILLNDLEGTTGTCCMEAHMHARDQDHSREMHYFNFTTILAATNSFSDENKLGEGGFGPVYKGKLLNGKEVAVKRFWPKSGQGHGEFENEVMLLVKLQHKNLVRLLGYCTEGDEKLLVYEYMANTSLDSFLFDPTKSRQLDWAKRAAIVGGIARGLLYLHEDSRLKIIHRDLKASNILLDEEMNPKISDFGTARIFGQNQIDANTSRVVGTFGYMAPEYAMEGLFSVKSDTYSFGVLLLEILSGKKNSGFHNPDHSQSLLSYAWRLWNEDKGLKFIDQNLVDTCPVSEALRWIHIALLCVQEEPNDRPLMSSVALMLGSKSVNLPQPSAPPFSMGRHFMSDQSSTTGTSTGFLMSDQD